jgi:hypothetical protein
MLTRLFASMLLLVSSALAFGTEHNEDAEAMAMVSFILDVTTYEGMFYSVQDFCTPNTDSAVSMLSSKQWHDNNNDLLSAREAMEQKYLGIMRSRGVEAEANTKLQEVKKATFLRSHDNSRLYKDIVPLQDKYIACSKRLGEMASDSMSFQAIAPDSYKFWRANIKP